MNLQRYLRQQDPQRLTGDDLMQFRKGAQEMLKSGNDAAVLTAISIMKLLGHIDYMTLEAMKSEPLSIENEEAKENVSRKTQIRAKRS